MVKNAKFLSTKFLNDPLDCTIASLTSDGIHLLVYFEAENLIEIPKKNATKHSVVKFGSKKMRQEQKLAISKKSTFFVRSS